MRFGIIDHNDDTGRPHVRQVAERLELIEAYDRLGLETCFGDMTIQEALQSAELLATEVIPHFA